MSVEQITQRTSGEATASFVLGITGLVVLPPVLSILAVVFGKKARDEIQRDRSVGGHGLATAGIVLGWVGIAMFVVVGLILLVGFLLLGGYNVRP